MSQYFPKPYDPFGGDINAKIDLSNYATKTDLKNISHADVSSFALKSILADLKTEVDKHDIGKLQKVPVDLAKLSNKAANDVITKTQFTILVSKVHSIDTTDFVKKTKYEKDGSDSEDKINKVDKKIPDVSDLVKKTDFNTKVTEIEGKIPSISGLATKFPLTIVENKIPDVSGLVKKTDYNTKISEIENKVNNYNHDKYITTPEFNTLAADVFNARLAAQTDLIRKPEFDFKLKDISDRVIENKTLVLLLVENELKKLKTLGLSYFWGKNYFEGNDGVQNVLVFQTVQKHFNLSNVEQISKWKSKGLSNQYLNLVGTLSDIVLSKPIKPMHVIFKRKDALIQDDNDIIAGGPIVNIYIVYKTSPKTINSNFVFKHCLFGAIKIANTINSGTDKLQCFGYGIEFDLTGSFTHPDGGNGKNVIIFGADLSNSTHAANKTQSVLVLGHGLIQKINDTITYAEKIYSPNLTVDNKIFCLSLHHNGDNKYLFVNGKEVTKFKAKNSELIKYPMCLGGLSKDYTENSRKGTGLYGNVYDFSVDYSAITNDEILGIHN